MTPEENQKKPAPARSAAELMGPPEQLAPASRPRPVSGYITGIAGIALITGAFLPFRDTLTDLSPAFAYVALVVVVAWIGGSTPAITSSVLAFAAFNLFFLPPFETFAIESGEHVALLIILLAISLVVSTLLARTRQRADTAEAREAELHAMQELSREMVVRVPGKEAYEAILRRLASLLELAVVSLFLRDEATGELREEVVVGTTPGTLDPRSSTADGGLPVERLTLSVGRHNLGMLTLARRGRALSPGESRVLRAFCDQLAIVLERDRLLHVAARAESYRQAEKLRQALLTAVSHDLRSPLLAIKSSIAEVLGGDPSPDQRESLTLIDKDVDRLNLLIANLLDMSRMEAGILRARIEPINLAGTIEACIDQAQRRWPGVRFASSIDPTAARVLADPVFADRVVTNLLDNAGRSTLQAGSQDVEIQARGRDGSTVVRVIDHGQGVPASAREQLFHPFYELDERSPRLGPGLGLAICKGFLVAMRGEVWVEDTPGGGATIAFSLPAAPG